MKWLGENTIAQKQSLRIGKKSSLTSQEVIESCHVAVLPFSSVVCQQQKRIYFSTLFTGEMTTQKLRKKC